MGKYIIGIDTLPAKYQNNDQIDCQYSGAQKSITLPPGIYQLECWGAQGNGNKTVGSKGGAGGYVKGTMTLKHSQILYLVVGGEPIRIKPNHNRSASTGGFNGGGTSTSFGGGGGGASDIRVSPNDLNSRIIVAGGGGGGGYQVSCYGGAGGGSIGIDGDQGSYVGGTGGTQVSGGIGATDGSFGLGASPNQGGGAGGGGWYGGGSGITGNSDSAGGGGSGYVFTSTSSKSSSPPSSEFYLTNTINTNGNNTILSPDGINEIGHQGPGYIRITVLQNTWRKSISIKTNANTWSNAKKIFIKTNTNTWDEIPF